MIWAKLNEFSDAFVVTSLNHMSILLENKNKPTCDIPIRLPPSYKML